MSRQAINAEQLHALLVREFAQARFVDCVTRCQMPKPLFREADGLDVANWIVRPGLTCPRHCHRIITEVATRLAAQYDLEPAPGIAA
jgi:hypothetical protein